MQYFRFSYTNTNVNNADSVVNDGIVRFAVSFDQLETANFVQERFAVFAHVYPQR